MNIIEFFIVPIAGGVIGYFTNWLAIKMLFRPYTEKRIFGIRIPFTPGLIPKEKNRIAQKIGATVGEHLLSEEVMVKALVDEKVVESLGDIISEIFIKLRQNEESMDDILIKVLGKNKNKSIEYIKDKLTFIILEQINRKDILDGIVLFILNKIENMLNKKVEDKQIDKLIQIDFFRSDFFRQWIIDELIIYKDKLINEERTLSQIVSKPRIDDIKELIRNHFPKFISIIIEYMQKPSVETKVKQILLELIQENLGKFALMFVDSEKIYEKLIQYIEGWVEKEEKKEEIIEQINSFIDYSIEKPIKDLANKVRFINDSDKIEIVLNKGILYLTKKENIEKLGIIIKEYISNKDDTNLLNIIKKVNSSILYDIEKWIRNCLETFLRKEELPRNISIFISKEINILINTDISQWMNRIDNSVEEKIKSIVLRYYKELIISQSSYIFKILNISHIVEERIIDFETDYTEKIILSVVDRELKAITWLGGVLGFIIGFFPVLFNYL